VIAFASPCRTTRFRRLAVAHRRGQRAAAAAELLPGGVHVVKEIPVAEVPDNGGRGVAGQALCPPPPAPDPPPAIDAVDAVVEIVDDRALEHVGRIDRHRRSEIGWFRSDCVIS